MLIATTGNWRCLICRAARSIEPSPPRTKARSASTSEMSSSPVKAVRTISACDWISPWRRFASASTSGRFSVARSIARRRTLGCGCWRLSFIKDTDMGNESANSNYGFDKQGLLRFAHQLGECVFSMIQQGVILRRLQLFAEQFHIVISVVAGAFQSGDDFAQGDNALAQPAAVLLAVWRLMCVAQLHYSYVWHDFADPLDKAGI